MKELVEEYRSKEEWNSLQPIPSFKTFIYNKFRFTPDLRIYDDKSVYRYSYGRQTGFAREYEEQSINSVFTEISTEAFNKESRGTTQVSFTEH